VGRREGGVSPGRIRTRPRRSSACRHSRCWSG
jgi:hypothetical protein